MPLCLVTLGAYRQLTWFRFLHTGSVTRESSQRLQSRSLFATLVEPELIIRAGAELLVKEAEEEVLSWCTVYRR